MSHQCDPQPVTVRPGREGDIVALAGELDLATAPGLQPALRGLLAQGRNRILIDLAEVTFMDGFALGVLIAAQRDVRRAGGRLRVTNHPLLLRLLVFTGITGLFTLETAQMR